MSQWTPSATIKKKKDYWALSKKKSSSALSFKGCDLLSWWHDSIMDLSKPTNKSVVLRLTHKCWTPWHQRHRPLSLCAGVSPWGSDHSRAVGFLSLKSRCVSPLLGSQVHRGSGSSLLFLCLQKKKKSSVARFAKWLSAPGRKCWRRPLCFNSASTRLCREDGRWVQPEVVLHSSGNRWTLFAKPAALVPV